MSITKQKTKNANVTKSLKSNNWFKFKGKLTTSLFGLPTKRALQTGRVKNHDSRAKLRPLTNRRTRTRKNQQKEEDEME